MWIGSKRWGLGFKVDGRCHHSTDISLLWFLHPWRTKMWRAAQEAVKNPNIKKWGFSYEEGAELK